MEKVFIPQRILNKQSDGLLKNIFGAVANDRIYTTITLYEAQVLTAEETVARLKVDGYFNQISFHSQSAADELEFMEAAEVLE